MKVRIKEATETRPRKASAVHLGRCRIRVNVRHFGPIEVDEPEKAGGTDTAPSPLEYFTSGLAACQVISIAKVANSIRFEFSNLSVDAEADVSFKASKGELGSVPRFSAARLSVNLRSSEPPDRIERLKALVEERCPASNLFSDAGIPPQLKWNIHTATEDPE